jgi:hypothetical protein
MILKLNNLNFKDNKSFVLQIWNWRSTNGTARRTRGLFYRYDTEDQQFELQGEQSFVLLAVQVVDLQYHICKTNLLLSLQYQLLIFSIISVKQTSCCPWRSTTGTARTTRGLFYRYDTEDQQLELQGEQELCFTDMILKINNWYCKDNKRFVLQIWIISVKQTSCCPCSSSCWSSVSHL